jgi:hypothetical protein
MTKAQVTLALSATLLFAAAPASAAPFVFHVPVLPGGPLPAVGGPGGDPITDTEVDQGFADDDEGDDSGLFDEDASAVRTTINRSIAGGPGVPPPTQGRTRAKSNPEVLLTLAGLNFHDQRFANNGNQFSVEPPDQGLCAGNGYVLESANDVLRIYGANGTTLTNVIDLNTFYHYAPAIDRTKSPLQFGPSITDPSCYFDPDTQRWFHVVLTLDRANKFTQGLSGANHLDVAVSQTSDPTGAWNFYSIPVQNDGTQGTPDHHCRIRISNNPPTFVPGPCLGDYPHIGADANGFYITTNEFDLAAPGQFHGAQVYALSKHQLAAGTTTVTGVLFNTADSTLLFEGVPGFTIWPAQSPGGLYDTAAGGTEFLLSSIAVFSNTGVDSRLRVWSITNTASLDSASPAPVLASRTAATIAYAVPGRSAQKASTDLPLLQCIATASCAPLVGATRATNAEVKPTSNDSRMQQVAYANGKLWGALDTGLTLDGGLTAIAGIAYFVINPDSLNVATQGYVALPGNNLIYPSVAVNPSGRGVMAFTVLGPDHFPSAGYVSLDAKIGAGDVHVVSEGVGADDGFSGYVPLVPNQNRPRWGDYSAAAVDGNTIWIAAESIEQSCTFAQYLAAPFGQCGGTRGSLGNWGTRIARLNLAP